MRFTLAAVVCFAAGAMAAAVPAAADGKTVHTEIFCPGQSQCFNQCYRMCKGVPNCYGPCTNSCGCHI
ncbi:hypothetical protein BC828DRAFT_415728 [Blastocladiella britannica]|nr:hypothetical protein BC828DRAFT_415728 [Blastocladiella britannica]